MKCPNHRYAALLFILLPFISISQSSFSITEWKSVLSSNNDIGNEKLNEVAQALLALEPSQRCDAINQLHQLRGNTKFKIRTTTLWSYIPYVPPGCYDTIPMHEKLEQALEKAYETGDNILAVAVHEALSNTYYMNGDLGQSIIHMLTAKELMESEGLENFRNYSNTLYRLTNLLYTSKDYRAAAMMDILALQYKGSTKFNHMDSLSEYWKMNTWNNLGLSYEKLMLYDSAMYAFDQALQVSNDSFWQGLISGNKGDVFFLQGKYDSAEALLRLDYTRSLAQGEHGNAAFSLQRLARITSAHGHPKKALAMMHTANSLHGSAARDDFRAAILYSYAVIYRDLGMADSAFEYLEKHKILSDSMAKYTAENKLGIARLHMANRDNIYQIESLQKDKSRIQLIRNFSIALILALAAFGYVYINRMRLQSRFRQQEALEAKRRAETEASHAKDQLSIFTESLREKTKLLEDIQIKSLEKEHQRDQFEKMQELATYTILTDADWDRFKSLFSKVHPGFFIELKKHVPDITLAEQRMAALIKLDIGNREAANMLGISHNSIYKTRQRLRHRLGFEKDDEMDLFFREKISPLS